MNDSVCSKSIVFEIETGETIELFSYYKLSDTIIHQSIDGKYSYKIKLFDCMGTASISKYDSKNREIAHYTFKAGKDILTKYIYFEDPNNPGIQVGIEEYYSGIRDGIWLYYDKKGNIIKKEQHNYPTPVNLKNWRNQ